MEEKHFGEEKTLTQFGTNCYLCATQMKSDLKSERKPSLGKIKASHFLDEKQNLSHWDCEGKQKNGDWSLSFVIPTLGRLKQENFCEFKASLDHTVSSKAAKAT
jgi:hypothetical protein